MRVDHYLCVWIYKGISGYNINYTVFIDSRFRARSPSFSLYRTVSGCNFGLVVSCHSLWAFFNFWEITSIDFCFCTLLPSSGQSRIIDIHLPGHMAGYCLNAIEIAGGPFFEIPLWREAEAKTMIGVVP